MTTCPVCSRPMPATRKGEPRVYCGNPCRNAGWAARIRVDQSRVDPAAVYRLTHGDPVASTKAERVEATCVLMGRGVAQNRIAEMLHVTTRSIWRYSNELRNGRKAA